MNVSSKISKLINKISIVGLLLIPLLASACSKPTSVATSTVAPTSQQNTGYPGPNAYITENPSYPAPIFPTVGTPLQTEAIDPQMGVIQGKLLRNNIAVPDVSLALATVMKDNNGNDIVAGLDLVTAETATTGQQGSFTFINVKPGRYALILDIVTHQFLLNYPDKENPIILQVEAGKEINLGDLNYNELPSP